MISKIFDILLGVKKTSHITKSTHLEAIERIVSEVTAGNVNPVEAYVMLDYIKNVTDEAMKEIKASTLDYIQKEGENIAFNVKLGLSAKKEYAFEEDKDWIEINKKMSIFKDAQAVRERFLSDIVNKSIEAGKAAPIRYITNISIIPEPLSNN